ncbi:peptide/nickel transport system ATP-binding protein/oligopeptide transport system ATP-binding protein [Rhizobiales bacterium GAS191]|nr:peptide/nickel transport system ATP-binding protein/oligopeptide transport system ATP-binding protein [Rhizobiales bacterium GAS191]
MPDVSSSAAGPMPREEAPLVSVRGLKAYFPLRRIRLGAPKAWLRAVDGVSFDIRRGETLGLVGESGCGKSTLGRTLLALRGASAGDVLFDGNSVFSLKPWELKALRRHMQLVFQDPFASLNPRQTVGGSVRAALDIHAIGAPAERTAMVEEMFLRVGLRRSHTTRFPHEFSGGQRQRIGIARALVLRPKFLVCDEPVSALDVSIQAQILNLLKDLQQEFELTYLFISHNLAVVEHMADRVAVMYYGKIVELADRNELFSNPRHPYTRTLLGAVPSPDPTVRNMKVEMSGDPPDPANLPSGCRFRNRCSYAMERCSREEPAMAKVGKRHHAACWLDQ